ncbi:23S rRNA pseudouridine(1911/1915/1917) synthase RluD [Marinibactrum halimedae]|uniref:Pseudouridine synthase n=1 Tax=Marinibactrum halimedae TaxID=1444977 RepID=A0AA37T6I0_9GAMM|nr:23S rRNA pseudouridine(1911/1915/1917) synthase RluD [Marinibactrum halimedae]MCD9460237.1 23S rRNA pseudouridine(1911/1915/1917) synthase RluD [Marinibactrum halimedae]GLS27930.1 pseudouridine synthase [Marinibactrum halimedae]
MSQHIQTQVIVPDHCSGQRLDQVAAQLFPEFSRSQLQSWIKNGDLTVDTQSARPKDKLLGGENLQLDAQLQPQGEWTPQAIELDIIYEDDDIIVINKPAGLVVHPAAGNRDGTLLNALLAHCPEQENLPRAGIVHRLDKDTTGLMVVAKTLQAHNELITQLQERSVSREYEAVVIGTMTGGGKINAPIGRHPKQRKLMAVVNVGGKEAITHYRLLKRFPNHTHVRVKLETGRTHQIRVHMAHNRHPLVGDSVYAGRFKIPKGASPELVEQLKRFPRQALHAAQLGLFHPESGEYMQWQAPLPEDFDALLSALVDDAAQGDSLP